MFIKEYGDWTKLRGMGSMFEVDFHYLEGRNYFEKMALAAEMVLRSLKKAQDEGKDYVMFIHGYSTSGRFRRTARSVVRSIMRSKESTPFIIKNKSIQHETVFLAKIKQKK